MLADELHVIVKKLSKENATDKDIAALARLAHNVAALEDTAKSTERVSFYAGYTAGWNDHRDGKSMDVSGSLVRYNRGFSFDAEPKTVDLVDLDTQQTLQDVTVAKRIVNVPPISHTAFNQLVERVMTLENIVLKACLEEVE